MKEGSISASEESTQSENAQMGYEMRIREKKPEGICIEEAQEAPASKGQDLTDKGVVRLGALPLEMDCRWWRQ